MENRKGPSPWLTFVVGTALTLFWIYLNMGIIYFTTEIPLNIRHWKDPNADYMSIALNIVITAALWIGLGVAIWWNIRNAHNARNLTPRAANVYTSPSADDIQLTLVDLFPECSRSDDRWTYKSKVRAVFRNDTQETLFVETPEWKAGADGLLAQKPFRSLFNLEGPHGWAAGDWQVESTSVQVRPGRAFQVWIGFDLDIEKDPKDRSTEIRRRAVQHKLGILTFSFKKSGTDHSWSQQL